MAAQNDQETWRKQRIEANNEFGTESQGVKYGKRNQEYYLLLYGSNHDKTMETVKPS